MAATARNPPGSLLWDTPGVPYEVPYAGNHGGQWTGAYGWTGRAPYSPPRNGFGLAALITGLTGLAIGLTVVLSPLGFVLGAVAVAVGVAALRRVRAGAATNGGQARAGTWVGAVVVSAVLSAVLVSVVADLFRFTEVTSTAGTADSPAMTGETVVYADGFTVAATLATAAGTDEGGRSANGCSSPSPSPTAGARRPDCTTTTSTSMPTTPGCPAVASDGRGWRPGHWHPARRRRCVSPWSAGDAEIPGLDCDFAYWEFDLSGPDGVGRSEDTTVVSV